MVKHYTLEDKPTFNMNEFVTVDMARMGMPEYGMLNGRIVGRSIEHIVDHWLVDFNQEFPTYPYEVVAVLHTAIVDERS